MVNVGILAAIRNESGGPTGRVCLRLGTPALGQRRRCPNVDSEGCEHQNGQTDLAGSKHCGSPRHSSYSVPWVPQGHSVSSQGTAMEDESIHEKPDIVA